MIDVTVKVPEERVPAFYAMYGIWLAAPEVPPEGPAKADELRPWGSDDQELAAELWSRLSDAAKRLFSILIDAPESRFSADKLAELSGIPNGKQGVAGALGWPGRHAYGLGRQWFWSWKPAEDGFTYYWMSADTAAIFRGARDGK